MTLQEQIEEVPCWLLVADIKNFTPLTRELLSAETGGAGQFVAGQMQRHHRKTWRHGEQIPRRWNPCLLAG